MYLSAIIPVNAGIMMDDNPKVEKLLNCAPPLFCAKPIISYGN
jgi:hypothetical protein